MSLQEVPPILPVSLKINNTLRNYYRIFKNIFHTLSYWYNSRGVTSTSWWRHLRRLRRTWACKNVMDSRCAMLMWQVWWELESLRLFQQRVSQHLLPYLDQRQYFCCFFHLKKDNLCYSRCLVGWLPISSIQLCLSVVYQWRPPSS